jgi:dimethylhistidine N-methyltransferase
VPNDIGLLPHVGAETVALALAGLKRRPKTLPPSLFYDEAGCRLFYEITRLPEYYLTRTEKLLLGSIGEDLLPAGFDGGTVVEFGGSDEAKARFLLDIPGRVRRYVPVDVAGPAMAAMAGRLRVSHPGLEVEPMVADFMQPLRLPAIEGPRIGYFPGSTIGNLDPAAAVAFLASARRALGSSAWFLMGADLRKSPKLLVPAYDDAAGVTAAFNLNLLVRLNREAGADFAVEDFRHLAVWNDALSRIEMHLVSERAQTVRVGGETVRFEAGESIHTENSYKHRPEALVGLAKAAGWVLERQWADPKGWFGVFLLRSS